MAARTRRAVRVTPGATQDRRSFGVGAFPPSVNPRHKPTFFDKQDAGLRIKRGKDVLDGLVLDVRERINPAPGVVRQFPRFRRDRPDAKTISPPRGASQAQVSAADSFSVLYELEHHRGALEILLLLNRQDLATKSTLRQHLRPGPEALGGAIRSLLKLDLVETFAVQTFPFAKTYRLTGRGKAILDSPLPSWPSLILK
jgi:hypothetical protein